MWAGKHLAPIAVQLKLKHIHCVPPMAKDEQPLIDLSSDRSADGANSSPRFGYPNSPLHLKRNTPLEFIDKAHPQHPLRIPFASPVFPI